MSYYDIFTFLRVYILFTLLFFWDHFFLWGRLLCLFSVFFLSFFSQFFFITKSQFLLRFLSQKMCAYVFSVFISVFISVFMVGTDNNQVFFRYFLIVFGRLKTTFWLFRFHCILENLLGYLGRKFWTTLMLFLILRF